ncbi:MAG: AI-2E family transporter [Acidimicrobiaceae bacterium]|nr:AI-2E family transporter [Acidimicrobiaceae bacterium]
MSKPESRNEDSASTTRTENSTNTPAKETKKTATILADEVSPAALGENSSATDSSNLVEPTENTRLPPWVKRGIIFFWLSALGAFYFTGLVRVLGDILTMLVASLFLSFAIEPAVNVLQKRGVKRYLGTTIVFLLGAIGVLAMITAVGRVVVLETSNLIEQAPGYIDKIQEQLKDNFNLDVSFDKLRERLINTDNMQTLAEQLGPGIFDATVSITKILVHVLAGLLFTFYLVADGPKLRRLIVSSLDPAYKTMLLNIWDLAINKTGGYIYSRMALSAISSIFHWIAFIVLDVPSPLTLALWVGIISQFIPAVGTYIAGVMPIIVTLLDNPEHPQTALWTLIVVVLYQQVENYVFAPRVTAHTMKLHVAVAFGSVFVGITLLGVVGAFLSLPCAATLQAWLSSWHAARNKQQLPDIQEDDEHEKAAVSNEDAKK